MIRLNLADINNRWKGQMEKLFLLICALSCYTRKLVLLLAAEPVSGIIPACSAPRKTPTLAPAQLAAGSNDTPGRADGVFALRMPAPKTNQALARQSVTCSATRSPPCFQDQTASLCNPLHGLDDLHPSLVPVSMFPRPDSPLQSQDKPGITLQSLPTRSLDDLHPPPIPGSLGCRKAVRVSKR